MPRVSPRSRRTTATFLACAVLTACQGSPSSAPPPATTESAGTPAAAPHRPLFAGRLAVRLQPALTAVGETACTPAHNRVCSTDGTQGWVPIKDPREATLVRAAARLTDRHTSWTTLLRFDRASRQALHTAAADAAAAGGVVLLLHDDHAVTALAPLDVRGVRVTITGLDKPESWDLVADVDAAQQGE